MSSTWYKHCPTLWNYVELMYYVFLCKFLYRPVCLIHAVITHISLSQTVQYWLRNVAYNMLQSWTILLSYTMHLYPNFYIIVFVSLMRLQRICICLKWSDIDWDIYELLCQQAPAVFGKCVTSHNCECQIYELSGASGCMWQGIIKKRN